VQKIFRTFGGLWMAMSRCFSRSVWRWSMSRDRWVMGDVVADWASIIRRKAAIIFCHHWIRWP
jgi:hypothetical protein